MASKKNTGKANSSTSAAPTVKEERAQRRLAKIDAFKKEQARRKRTRAIAIWAGAVASVAVIAIIATLVIVTNTPKVDPQTIALTGLKTWTLQSGKHVDPSPVNYLADYGMNPPAGGAHWSAELNCGVYTEPQQNELAVHSLEHAAVWVTYNPDQVSGADLKALTDRIPRTYTILSPYPGLDAPVVASAWGAQVKLSGVDDKRLDGFMAKYRESPSAPEPGAPCSGSVDGPGKVR